MPNLNFKSFIPAIIWLLVILIISGFPGNKVPKIPVWQFDKLIHSIIYLVLSILLLMPFSVQYITNKKRLKTQLIIILVGISYGGFMEILQHYIFINRSGNLYDFIANAIGAIIGVLIYPHIIKLLPINKWLP
jgi:VanZ family protein